MQMKKVIFTNRPFYILLVALIGLLMAYNFYLFLIKGISFALIPIIIEFVLLVLILTRNQYAKWAIIIWTSVFSIIGYGLKFLADLMDGFKSIKLDLFLENTVGLMIGILIISYAKRTIVVASSNTDLTKTD